MYGIVRIEIRVGDWNHDAGKCAGIACTVLAMRTAHCTVSSMARVLLFHQMTDIVVSVAWSIC